MKKKWINADIKCVNLVATENQPSAEISVDDLINGVFTFGKRDSSGPAGEIIYSTIPEPSPTPTDMDDFYYGDE